MELLNDFYLVKITLHCVPDWWSMFDLSWIATVVSKYVSVPKVIFLQAVKFSG